MNSFFIALFPLFFSFSSSAYTELEIADFSKSLIKNITDAIAKRDTILLEKYIDSSFVFADCGAQISRAKWINNRIDEEDKKMEYSGSRWTRTGFQFRVGETDKMAGVSYQAMAVRQPDYTHVLIHGRLDPGYCMY